MVTESVPNVQNLSFVTFDPARQKGGASDRMATLWFDHVIGKIQVYKFLLEAEAAKTRRSCIIIRHSVGCCLHLGA